MVFGDSIYRNIILNYLSEPAGLGGFMACLATLQSTVEKPKEIEESCSESSLEGMRVEYVHLE